jgi:hypothetical protein
MTCEAGHPGKRGPPRLFGSQPKRDLVVGEAEPSMSTMISEVSDAFIAAGALADKARKPAETLANYDD